MAEPVPVQQRVVGGGAMKESDLQRNVLKALNAMDDVKAIANHQAGYGRKGEPDIFGCVAGRAFVIELKVGKNKPTELQLQRLKEWSDVNAFALVCHSVDVATTMVGGLSVFGNKERG
jgi:hypothetical protein